MPQRLLEHQSSAQCGALTGKEKESWLIVHFKVILALYAVSHFGIVLLAISIVLCTQDTKTGKTQDGTVIFGVVDLACIICSFFAGYDLLLAEYSTDKRSVRNESRWRYTEGVITEQSQLEKKDNRLLANSKENEQLSVAAYIPCSSGKVEAAKVPQNNDSRLPSPFRPTDSPPCKNHPTSRPPHMPPGEVYKEIREIRRLARLSAITIQPLEDPVPRWSA